MHKPRKPERLTLTSLARRVERLERRCRACPEVRRPVGFQPADAIGERIPQDEDGEET